MKTNRRIAVFLMLLLNVFFLSAQAPFTKGVNLTNWFQAGSAREIQFSKYTREDFIRIKGLGCDVIRLPINLHFMTSGAPDYTLDPLFLDLLDQTVDWAEELQIYLMLDNHTFDPNADTTPEVEGILLKVWPQMAEHFKDRSNFLLFEVLNEPHGITNTLWCTIQGNVINAIRAIDTKHTIVVGPADYNSYNQLKNMPVYTDTNLLYTFHFYDPFMFTHQGASWTSGMQDVSGVPFPYVASKMPAIPASAMGTWVAGSLNNYKYDGTVAKVKQWLDIAANFKTTRNVNLFCGEFGVYIPNSPQPDRVYWYEVVRKYLEEKGISWTTWDYQGGFGLFEKGTSELFEYDLDTALLKSLNFNIPEQKDFVATPETKPFNIYTDYIAQSVFSAGSPGIGGTIDYYSTDAPQEGKYSLFWTGSSKYSGPAFDLKPNKDLSHMVTNNYELDFWVRGDTPGTRFEIRFVDTKTAVAGDHPWRISYTFDQSKVTWDGTWQHVKIPLKSFKETGSWDGSWFDASGKFDWKAVDRLEIIAEYNALGTQKIWFDQMQINGIPFTSIKDQTAVGPFNASIYPNPMKESATLQYDLPEAGYVNVGIYNMAGHRMATIVDQRQNQGRHLVRIDRGQPALARLTDGLYVCKITSSGKSFALKLVVKH